MNRIKAWSTVAERASATAQTMKVTMAENLLAPNIGAMALPYNCAEALN